MIATCVPTKPRLQLEVDNLDVLSEVDLLAEAAITTCIITMEGICVFSECAEGMEEPGSVVHEAVEEEEEGQTARESKVKH